MSEIIIYEDTNGEIKIDVSLENETVRLSQKQLGILFDRDKSVISRHIKNIFKEGEREVVREIEFYNLDMIISLGYRVNSKRATGFRIWATKVLKEYLVNGYALNQKRLGMRYTWKNIEDLQGDNHAC